MKISEFPLTSSAASDDKLLIEQLGIFKSITKANLLASFSSGGSLAAWDTITASYTATAGKRIISSPNTADITITLPASPVSGNEIEVINISATYKTLFNFGSSKLDAVATTNRNISLKGAFNYVKLLYIDASNGWVQIPQKTLNVATAYESGMRLLLEFGSLIDQSGFNNNPTSVSGTLPDVAIGLNSQKVLRFNGNGTQELQIPYFMSGTTAATLYVVFTVSVNSSYNLIRTADLDDYWKFSSDGNGYIGTFLNARKEAYPPSMPSSGSHLMSIHASASSYEVILDKVSKGAISNVYSSGNRFRIATNDKPFNGDIALILVYPSLINKTSTQHQAILSAIKLNYPSLPFTL